ncbi:MAG: YdcF family protein [Rhizobiaceae bacterium]
MFFYASKIFWFFIQPLNLAIFLLLLGLLARLVRFRRASLAAFVSATLVLVLAVWTSAGQLALGVLEDRFARPPAPAEIAGIVVLGGGFEGAINLVRGGYELNSAGDRFVETAVLARRYPRAKVVISGGDGSLLLDGELDATAAMRLLTALGVERDRLVLETRSRNTHENAVFTRELVSPRPGETWLLVTSAFHMPRSIGLFRKTGFAVTPWPVDYRTSGREGLGLFRDNQTDTLVASTLAIREWIGLTAYWLTGQIDSPFPGPH